MNVVVFLAKIARECPQDYSEAGSSFEAFQKHPNIVKLSLALSCAGLKNLSKAVPHGCAWAREIGRAVDARDLLRAEYDASSEVWTWNQ